MLKIEVAASDGAGSVNEDVVGAHASAVWVIDGATGVGPGLLDVPSDAAWFAGRVDRELRSQLKQDAELPTAELLRRVMEACRAALEEEGVRRPQGAHELPSAAFAMVRQMGRDIEFSTLGDCRIAYRTSGVAHLFGTTGLTEIEGLTIGLARRYLQEDPDITQSALREKLMPQLQVNRRSMNVPGGYWVLGTDPIAAANVDRLTLPARAGDTFTLASDGYLRLIELFEVASVEDLLAIDSLDSFTIWLSRLRELEAGERSCHRHPRVKVHDDATLAHCRVIEEV